MDITPTITALGRRRLRKLERHLRTGTLGHKEFDFNNLNCGCALGEMPIVDQRRWRFSELQKQPVLREGELGTKRSAVEYFGISIRAVKHLFYPLYQIAWLFGGTILEANATRHQVADNIAAFLAVARTVTPEGAAT